MPMGTSDNVGTGSFTNSLLIVSNSNPEEITDFFRQNSIPIEGKRLHLQTKYFEVDAAFLVLSVNFIWDLMETRAQAETLGSFPAIMILSLCSEDVPEYQKVWTRLERHLGEDATKGFVVADRILGVEEDHRLDEWAGLNHIEFISQCTCEGVAISNKIRQLLECAPWLSPSPIKTVPFLNNAKRGSTWDQVPIPGETTAEDGFTSKCSNEPMPSNVNTNTEVETERCGTPSLSSSTRLRRGLGDADVSNLVAELLTLADSDDDGIITNK